MSNLKENLLFANFNQHSSNIQGKVYEINKKNKQKLKSECDLFCFRECSDKYDELVFKKQGNWKGIQKVSLKKIHQQIKLDIINKSINKNTSQKFLSIYNAQKNLKGVVSIRTYQQQNLPEQQNYRYNIELLRQKKDVQKQLLKLSNETFRLGHKYEDKINQIKQIQQQIFNRKKQIQNYSMIEMERQHYL